MAPEEIAFTSTRTDAATYADATPDDLLSHVGLASARTQCYVRNALSEDFTAGEHQGEIRAIRILAIAWANAPDPAVRAALKACSRLLEGP
jgi:hypothetical protein